MKHNLLPYFAVLCMAFTGKISYAQDNITHIAIIPFSTTSKKAVSVAKDVQTAVASCFIKERFALLDRGLAEKIEGELQRAKKDASMYAKVVAESGRQYNSEYIITGEVDSLHFEKISSKDLLAGGVKNAISSKSAYLKYHGNIHFTLAIAKVESGKTIFSKPYNITSRDFDDDSHAQMMDNLLCRLTSAISEDVRKIIPPKMQIIRVEKTKKNGQPEVVLINGGTEIFDSGRQQTLCPGDDEINVASKTSVVSSLFKKAKGAISTNKMYLDVYSAEVVKVGGKSLEHDSVIGELRVDSNDADLSTCTVTKGADMIKSYMDSNKPLFIRIQIVN